MVFNRNTIRLCVSVCAVLLLAACGDDSIPEGTGGSGGTEQPRCGDSHVDPGEECDDGNADDTDACLSTCVLATCGDGVVREGHEACDDGNDVDEDECLSTCVLPTCGDGFVQPDEACDEGDANGDGGACLSNCLAARCGDGFIQAGVEGCDDGDDNSDTGACLTSCQPAACGDGFIHAGVEECDEGVGNSDSGACLATCRSNTCGDGFVHEGVELCDDGNLDDNDGCPTSCKPALCGDGFVQDGIEQCDDGNEDDTDGCLSTCSVATCGDGQVQAGVEDCDDGNDDDADDCLSTCRTATCGDMFVQAGVEECDDGNETDNDACTGACKDTFCGDGIVWFGEEICDLGALNSDAPGALCRTDCNPARCGDNIVDPNEACDDGGIIGGDGCSAVCAREGTSCASPIPIASTSSAFTVSGDTTTFESNVNFAFCTTSTSNNPEVFYSFTSPIKARWTFDLVPGPDLDATLAVLGSCFGIPAAGDEISCVDGPAEGLPEQIVVDLAASQTVLIAVDGFDDTDGLPDVGPFTLTGTASPIVAQGTACRDVNVTCDPSLGLICNANTGVCQPNVCGDGVQGVGEICDDGNVNDGDGCSSFCTMEGDTCLTAGLLPVRQDGTVRITGSTVGLSADYQAGCVDNGISGFNSDLYFAFTSPTDARWTFNIAASFNSILAVQSSCGDTATNIACDNQMLTRGGDSVSMTLGAGETVFILVDGYGNTTLNEGTFELVGTSIPAVPAGAACGPTAPCITGSFCYDLGGICVDTCGNGTLNPDSRETCDDGNRTPGDGCNENCVLATGYACPTPGQLCRPIVCGDGLIDGTEECDDGNTGSGDGCSATCRVEAIPLPEAGSTVLFHGELRSDDPTWSPPNSTCGTATRTGNFHYDTHYFVNDGPTDKVVSYKTTTWASSALLHMFNMPFNPATPTANCYQGALATAPSEANVLVPVGRTVAIVVSSGASNMVGPYALSVTNAPICGDGMWGTDEACDIFAAGCSSTCALDPGYTCDRTLGSCFPTACGDGFVGQGEVCDDGNANDGDICSNLCQLNGDTCQDLARITPDPVDGSFRIYGDTRLGTNDYAVSCVASNFNGDYVYEFTAPVGGTWRFVATALSGFNIAVEAQADCGNNGSSLACAGTTGTTHARAIEPNLLAGETIYLLVTGYGSSTVHVGSFTLAGSVTPFASAGAACGSGGALCGPGLTCNAGVCTANACGNGIAEFGEECDDGNTTAGDGCDATCRVEAIPIAAPGSSLRLNDSIAETDPTWSPPLASCLTTTRSGDWYYDVYYVRNDTSAPRRIDVAPTAFPNTALLFAYDLPFDPAQQLVGCAKGVSSAAPSLPSLFLRPGEAKAIVVSSGTTTLRALGPYTLRITTEGICGDGLWGDAEECDDNNPFDGDGCSAICTVEPSWTCDRAQAHCFVSICGDGLVGSGEACDDGNALEDDTCTSTCQWRGDTCATAAVLRVTGNSFSVEGDTAGVGADYQTACSNTSFSGDVFYTFTSPIHGTWRFGVRGNFDTAIAVMTACGDSSTELDCNEVGAVGALDQVEVELTLGQTVTIVVDGFGSTASNKSEGRYTLTGSVRPIVQLGQACDPDGTLSTCDVGLRCNPATGLCSAAICGNGLLESGEECDDGNTSGGDSCEADCRLPAIPLAGPGSAVTLTGSLDTWDPTWAPPTSACVASTRAGDWYHDVYIVRNTDTVVRTVDLSVSTFSTTGLLFIYDLPFDPATPIDRCGRGSSSSTPTLAGTDFQPGEAKAIVVSTGTTTTRALGPYDLRVLTQGVCGDTIFGNGEGCDDGNTNDGDGCSSTCTVEPTWSCTPALGCFTSQCGDGTVGNGEACDDGNLVDDDACNNSCQLNGETCADVGVIRTTVASPGFRIQGSTAGASATYSPTCAGTAGNSGERFYQFTSPVYGTWTFTLRGAAHDSALSVTSACGEVISELACSELGATGAADLVTMDLDVGETVFLVADGYSTSTLSHQGPFVLSGEVAPYQPLGATCDPVERTSKCMYGATCDASGATPVCVPAVCGNGLHESGEECDDSNFVSGDGCSPVCLREGTCDLPWVVSVASDNTFQTSSDTTGMPSTYALGCALTGRTPDMHFKFTAPASGNWRFSVAPTGFDSAIAVTRTCGFPKDTIACIEEGASGASDTVEVKLLQGETVFIVVDGYSGTGTTPTNSQGPFVLSGSMVRPILPVGAACDVTGVANECAVGTQCEMLSQLCVATICGNGVTQPGEACDNGANNGIDGLCSADCQIVGDSCAAPFDLRAKDSNAAPDALQVAGTTVDFNDDQTPSCFSSPTTATVQRDLVYELRGNSVSDEYWTLTLQSATTTQLVLDIASACVERNARIACSPDASSTAPVTLSFHLGAHETIYVWVDSETSTTTAYTLTGTIQNAVPLHGTCDPLQLADRCAEGLTCAAGTCAPAVCGDLIVEGEEECDAGPTGSSACSADCYRVGDSCNAPYNLNVLGQSVASGKWAHSGTLVGMTPSYIGTCSLTGSYNDVVYAFTAPHAGTYLFAETTSPDHVVYASKECPQTEGYDLNCSDTPDVLEVVLEANETVFFYVERYGSTTQGLPTTGTDFTVDVSWMP